MAGDRKVVIDLGSMWTRIGFAGDDEPSLVFSTSVGYPQSENSDKGQNRRGRSVQSTEGRIVGFDSLSLEERGKYRWVWPIEHGRVSSTGGYEEIMEILKYGVPLYPFSSFLFFLSKMEVFSMIWKSL